jgi:glycosyltransferase involved in cell wall biosynthesis
MDPVPFAAPGHPRVLVVCEAYAPAVNAGGGARSLVNAVARLGDAVSFGVLTRNHDWRDPKPFADLPADRWLRRSGAEVYYASRRRLGFRQCLRRVREFGPQVIYLNSVFSPLSVRMLCLRRAGRLRGRGLVIAPEGELGPGALSLKPWRKRLYLRTARWLGLFRGVVWKAASEREAERIRHWFGGRAAVRLAANLVAQPRAEPDEAPPSRTRRDPELQLAFFARLHAKKNLLFLLEAMRRVRGRVRLTIAGPIEDRAYWRRCERALADLGANARVSVHGPVEPDRVHRFLAAFDVFALPTLDENFGHAVLEALAAGCFVLLSPNTPWSDVEREGVGRILPLTDPAGWSAAIDELAGSDASELESRRDRARAYAARHLDDHEAAGRLHRLLVAAAAKPA